MLPPPATPGMALADVDTPALLIDLDAFERNLARMASAAKKAGVRLRAHAKTHKSPVIGLKQMAHGAVGVCCQKVSEAEVMVRGGVHDVLVSNQVVGRAKLERLALLAREAKIAVCVDNAENVGQIADAAAKYGVRIDVLVEIDVGAGRCGAQPGAAAATLAQHIAGQPNLHFRGIHAYHGGAQHLRTPAEREQAIAAATALVTTTLDALAHIGLAAEIVTGAGTGTYLLEASGSVYNEIQPGSYVFMDADYGRNLDAGGAPLRTFRHSLFVLTTVMSRPTSSRAVVDAGLKAHSIDSGLPLVADLPGARYSRASDEHGVIELDAGQALPLGTKIRLIPGHCDPTVNLHDWLVCVRKGIVEAVWPVAGRGAFY